MNFQPGDKVCFLNEKGEGVVVKVTNTHNVIVLSEGFEFVYPARELVKIPGNGPGQQLLPIIRGKEESYKKKSTQKPAKQKLATKKATAREVDLHIEELLESYSQLSNSEILCIQIERFVRELENAIAHREKKIIFIHGTGEGVLKREIRNTLADYAGIDFYDAPFNRYGFGATEVVIIHQTG